MYFNKKNLRLILQVTQILESNNGNPPNHEELALVSVW